MTTPPQQASDDGPAPRVVIAEDEALIRLDIREMLTDAGYEVVGEAGDGARALELVETLDPDLVLLDVRMPVMDGITAAESIASRRLAPVVMVTAYSQREQVERARDAGAMAYVVKPFSAADLVPAIEMARSRFSEITVLESEVADLQERLATRKLVEQAKARLQSVFALSEPDSFRWIQRTAMDKRTSMREVARLVLDEVSEGTPPDWT
jgi:response regulator NasT